MNIQSSTTIHKPPKTVWDYMIDPDKMPLWLDNFERYEHVSGKPGTIGSKGRHHYIENGRKFVMEETVLDQKEHEYIKLELTSKHMDMIIENHFKASDNNSTDYTASVEFTRVSLFMKIMMKLFMPPKKAQAQNDEQLIRVKKLVEEL